MSVRDRIKRMEQIAMQEREGAPDERGRSPGGVSNTSASGSPRPLSKVRTSFVAIADKEGRIGLARQPSGDSSVISERKLSGDTDAASSSILLDSSRSNALSSSPDTFRSERSRGPSGSFSRPGIPNLGAGPTSATPHTALSISGPVSEAAGAVVDPKPSTSSTPAGTSAESQPLGASFSSGSVPTSTGPTVSTSGLTAGSGQKGLAASPQIRKASRGEEAPGQRPSGGKPGQGVQESETRPARDQSQAQAKGSENALDHAGNKDGSSGGAGGTNTSAVTGTASLNGADKVKTPKPAPTSSTQAKTAGKAPEPKVMMTPAAEKKPIEKKATPSSSSPPFVKPRPKSPTQPVKLPERLTTHTGASAAKSKNAPPPARPASRTAMATSGKGLGRSASVVGRKTHASFGPPPKQAVDHPVLKKESKVDEGFLARMMRPTQAYANKVADKTQVPPKTPPRATANRKPASGKTGLAKRVVSRSMATPASANPDANKSEQSSAVKHTAKRGGPVAEQPVPAKKAEKQEPVVNISKKEDHIQEHVTASEKKADVPKPTETKVEPSKPVEQENTPKVAKPEQEAPKADGVKDDASKSLGQKEQLSKPVEKEESPKGNQVEQDVSNTIEKPEPTPKKASDAMFEAFMNPGPEKADVPLANGNYTEENKMNGSSDSEEVAKASIQPSNPSASSNVSNGLPTAVAGQNEEEQEEW
ncbi:hypothetical protein N0V82_000881 [Gnomoniopsis sp. IMI 355080]|nr:hypothetical protein N0V82_000881 [Gnomoniopsis sp. IMI 355080]